MKYGLTDSEFNFLTEQLIGPLKNYGAKVFIFGSRATGRYKKFSDIDLLYTSSPNLSNDKIYVLLAKMEESSFPYKIDLVCDDNLAQSYRESVNADKIEL